MPEEKSLKELEKELEKLEESLGKLDDDWEITCRSQCWQDRIQFLEWQLEYEKKRSSLQDQMAEVSELLHIHRKQEDWD